jgi:hypothetical protein
MLRRKVMIKYKGDVASIDNLEDALELFARNGIWVRITNKAKTDPYGKEVKEAFFKGAKNEN